MHADRKTYVYGYTDLLKLDLREKLSSLNAKTLILGASFPDKKVVAENYEKQYANLKTKQIEIANDSKHFIMFDQPAWFYDKVNAFLK
jgi:pimeloyl-ACP methyl ester carboxylesterase